MKCLVRDYREKILINKIFGNKCKTLYKVLKNDVNHKSCCKVSDKDFFCFALRMKETQSSQIYSFGKKVYVKN